jgi:hypothetical protein
VSTGVPRTLEESPLGDAIKTFIRREDAESCVEEVRDDDPEHVSFLRIEERELEAGGLNSGAGSRGLLRT